MTHVDKGREVNAPFRVLWLIKGLGLGGAERLLTSTASRIDRARYHVEVIYLLARSADFEPVLGSYGVPIVCLDARWTVESAWPRRLLRILRQHPYDLVHTHSPLPASAARLFAPRRTRFIHTEHNVWPSYKKPTYVVNALTYRRNERVLAVSEAVAASITAPWWAGPGRQPPVETLRHGVDLSSIRRGEAARRLARSSLGISDGVPLIGSVGNLTAQKDHLGLIKAMRRIHDQHPTARLVLIGTGPLEGDVRRAIERTGLRDVVRMLGARTDVTSLLPGLDIFVLGSRYEGLPIALVEAMASGVPCVATRVGGVPEAFQDGKQGRLVQPGDPVALADAVVGLLGDQQLRLRMGASGLRRAEHEFSIDRAVRRIEQVYREVLM